jgi:hypothetical protein
MDLEVLVKISFNEWDQDFLNLALTGLDDI